MTESTPYSELGQPPQEILTSILGTSEQVKEAMALEGTLAGRSMEEERERVLVHSLHRSNDLLRGCISTALGGSVISLETLCRSLIEELINAHWSSMTPENGKTKLAASRSEWHKYARANFNGKHAWLIDKRSRTYAPKKVVDELMNKLKSQEIVEPSLEQKSRECGLHKLYSTMYRGLSITAHGNDHISVTAIDKRWSKIHSLIFVFLDLHAATILSIHHFFDHKESVSAASLMSILFQKSNKAAPPAID